MDQNSITFSDMDSMVTRRASDDKEKNDKDTFKRFVMESGLSVRAKNVLLSNVQSLEAFEQLTEENLVFLPNCGEKTVREITEFLNTLRLQGGIQAPVSIEEMFLKSPIDSIVEMLPIFSNKRLHQVTSKDLHPDFQGDVKLEDIKLSHRTFYTLLYQGKMEIIGGCYVSDILGSLVTEKLWAKVFE